MTSFFLFKNAERIPIGPVDPRVAILRVEDAEAGTARALLVNYACHPVCHGGRNYKFSADFPGAMMAKVEEVLSARSESEIQVEDKATLKRELRAGVCCSGFSRFTCLSLTGCVILIPHVMESHPGRNV